MPLRKSPIASAQMVSTLYYGVEIDVCPVTGGIWLDKGELMKIVNNSKNDNYMEEFNRFHSRPQPVIEHCDQPHGYNVYIQDKRVDLVP
jgi:Zn-finger nucleic acid-binding protein